MLSFNQTNDYFNLYQLYPKAQSAYRMYSTETALLRVKHGILMNMNRQHVTFILVILDLSAAFDTVDHHNARTTEIQFWHPRPRPIFLTVRNSSL